MSNARAKTCELLSRLANRGINVDFATANTLRLAELTLRRWADLECGDGNDYASWAIERDEATGKPYMCRYPHSGKMSRYPVADHEKGALKRVKATGLHFYHQADPRGAALYVSNEPLTDQNYSSSGVCCAI